MSKKRRWRFHIHPFTRLSNIVKPVMNFPAQAKDFHYIWSHLTDFWHKGIELTFISLARHLLRSAKRSLDQRRYKIISLKSRAQAKASLFYCRWSSEIGDGSICPSGLNCYDRYRGIWLWCCFNNMLLLEQYVFKLGFAVMPRQNVMSNNSYIIFILIVN